LQQGTATGVEQGVIEQPRLANPDSAVISPQIEAPPTTLILKSPFHAVFEDVPAQGGLSHGQISALGCSGKICNGEFDAGLDSLSVCRTLAHALGRLKSFSVGSRSVQVNRCNPKRVMMNPAPGSVSSLAILPETPVVEAASVPLNAQERRVANILKLKQNRTGLSQLSPTQGAVGGTTTLITPFASDRLSGSGVLRRPANKTTQAPARNTSTRQPMMTGLAPSLVKPRAVDTERRLTISAAGNRCPLGQFRCPDSRCVTHLSACSQRPPTRLVPGFGAALRSKPPLRSGSDSNPAAQDVCAVKGYYGDGVCDRACAEPDPDCGTAKSGSGLEIHRLEVRFDKTPKITGSITVAATHFNCVNLVCRAQVGSTSALSPGRSGSGFTQGAVEACRQLQRLAGVDVQAFSSGTARLSQSQLAVCNAMGP